MLIGPPRCYSLAPPLKASCVCQHQEVGERPHKESSKSSMDAFMDSFTVTCRREFSSGLQRPNKKKERLA